MILSRELQAQLPSGLRAGAASSGKTSTDAKLDAHCPIQVADLRLFGELGSDMRQAWEQGQDCFVSWSVSKQAVACGNSAHTSVAA